MTEHRKLTKAGVAFIKGREAWRAGTYYDSNGTLSIGYGFTASVIPTLKEGDTLTRDEGDRLFDEIVEQFEKAVDQSLMMPVDDNQFTALVSLCYNIGAGNFAISSVLRLINLGKYPEAAEAFLLWNKETIDGKLVYNQGLMNRRREEKALFSLMIAQPEDGSQESVMSNNNPTPVDRRLYKTTEGIGGAVVGLLVIVNQAFGLGIPDEAIGQIVSLAMVLIGGRSVQKALSRFK